MKTRNAGLMLTLVALVGVGGATPLLLARPVGAQAQPARIKSADLPQLLENLGYKPEKVSDTVQRITLERGQFTFRLNVSISGNEKKLWMSTYLAQPAPEKLTAEVMNKLLTANSEVGPAHFYLTKTNDGKTWVRMGHALDNRDLTPPYIREELDWFCDRVAEKVDLWNIK